MTLASIASVGYIGGDIESWVRDLTSRNLVDRPGPPHPRTIFERLQRYYDADMRDREGAARMAAIANLPFGCVFEDPKRQGDDLILRATSAEGDEIEVAGSSTEEAWRAMAESLAALGEGRLFR